MAPLLTLENAENVLPDGTRFLASVDSGPDTGLAVVVDNGGSLEVIGAETLLEGVGVVIRALNKGLASDVVLHVVLGRVEGGVVRAAGRGVNETTGDASDEKRVVDLELDSVLELLVARRKHLVEAFGLGNSARESVKDETGQCALVLQRTCDSCRERIVLTRPGTPCC